jgi:hypothetical protein
MQQTEKQINLWQRAGFDIQFKVKEAKMKFP